MKILILLVTMFTCFTAVGGEKDVELQSPYNVIAPVLGSDPAVADRYPGQIYFNSTDDEFKAVDDGGDVRIIETDNNIVTYGVQFSGGSASTNCTTGNCTIENEIGSWVSSVSHDSTGVYTINFDSNTFTGRPSCTCGANDIGDGNRICNQSTGGSSSSASFTVMDNGFTTHDAVLDVVCVGTK